MRMAKIMRLSAAGERELEPMRWGFAGRSDVNPTRPKHMHARAETIDKLPTFRESFARLLPHDAWPLWLGETHAPVEMTVSSPGFAPRGCENAWTSCQDAS